MRLLAISDLHLGHPVNRERFATIGESPDDWLILAGDVGETEAHLALAFAWLRPRFAQVIWVPGNHELWTSDRVQTLRGDEKYQALVALARGFGVLTPEDPYPFWPGTASDRTLAIVPMFLLYDYSFRPDDVAYDQVLAWAGEERISCADEMLLSPHPWPDRASWCAARVALTEARLRELPPDCQTVLINHFPLRQAHARLPRIPRFTPWCGTRATETWPERYRALAVVYGHLHIRREFSENGTRFHEVSLGYPRQWDQTRPVEAYVKVILEV